MGILDKPGVYITGIGQIKVEKTAELSLREMGAKAIRAAMADAEVDSVDAVYVGNMLSGMLCHQQQLAPIVASEAGLTGVEAVTLEAACASGGAALRNGFMSIMSGMCDTVVVCGVEKMSHEDKEFITQSIATASDWEIEGSKGESFVTLNAGLMQLYLDAYKVSADLFANFGVNAHHNANRNPNALFHKEITREDYLNAKVIAPPLRLYDASPICDGSAAIVLSMHPRTGTDRPQIKITASAAASESVGIARRAHPLAAEGIQRSGSKAFQMAGITKEDVDFFELHDAYSIIATLSLEAMGFAPKAKAGSWLWMKSLPAQAACPFPHLGASKRVAIPLAPQAYTRLSKPICSSQIQLAQTSCRRM